METIPEEQVARNVADLRQQRRHTVRTLSARLGELGRPILPSGITKIEQQQRGVDIGDLVALAVALGVNPNRLLLPERAGDDLIALTPATHVRESSAWLWADGRFPLVTAEDEHQQYDPEMHDDFIRHARPVDQRLREQHTAVRAAHDVLRRMDRLLQLRENFPDPDALSPGSSARLEIQQTRGEIRRALARLVAEIDDLVGSEDAG